MSSTSFPVWLMDRAARKVAAEYAGLVDADDQRQDTLILLATNAELVREQFAAGTLGRLRHWLWCRLVDKVRPIAPSRNQTMPPHHADPGWCGRLFVFMSPAQ